MKKHRVGIIGYGAGTACHDDLDAFLSEVDVVDICSLPALHHAHALAAIRAGKHVILRESLITFEAVFAADRSAAEGGRPVKIAELG